MSNFDNYFKNKIRKIAFFLSKYLAEAKISCDLEELIKKGIVTIGKHSYAFPNIYRYLGNNTKLIIGNYTSISKQTNFILGGNHPFNWVSTFPLRIKFNLPEAFKDGTPSSKGDIKIGSDVWIGFNSTILSGIKIGDGAVITANSLVTASVPPFAIVGGVPAKIIKMRFEENIIEKLLQIKWWNWDDSSIKEAIPLLSSNNIGEFLENYGKQSLKV